MHKLTISAFAFVLLLSCNSGSQTNNTTDPEYYTEGWLNLFDDGTTDRWHQYGKRGVSERWKIEDSVVSVDTSVKDKQADLVTNDEFENFHLRLEWKISKGGNSGIIFYVHEDTTQYKQTFDTGPEMQIIDDNEHPDAKIRKHQAGDLYDLVAAKKAVKPVGEWNLAEIKSVDGKLDFYLNGKQVVSTTMWNEDWTRMVDNSKFKGWPGFSTFKKGHIALQDHGNEVWFRNVQIKRL
jgi:hypothetical protein